MTTIFCDSELEEKFAVLKEEYDKIMEERRIAREEQEARELELQHMMKVKNTTNSIVHFVQHHFCPLRRIWLSGFFS